MHHIAKPLLILLCLALLLPACSSSSPRAQAAASHTPTARPSQAVTSPTEPADTKSGEPMSASTAQPGSAPAQRSAVQASTVRAAANLRAGPGTTYAKFGAAQPGQTLQLVAKNAAGDWLQLADNSWIYAGLVANIPDLPAAKVTPPAAAHVHPLLAVLNH